MVVEGLAPEQPLLEEVEVQVVQARVDHWAGSSSYKAFLLVQCHNRVSKSEPVTCPIKKKINLTHPIVWAGWSG